MSSALPLRDRLQSNSPDPASPWTAQQTTPLRIAKRDSPQSHSAGLARRQSSSYKHLRTNHLVSKSPFRSQIPTPAKLGQAVPSSPRRVSGEKRPRSTSLVAQAENDHPLGFKRRQSKGFQGLLQKEPVTKSPFKHPAPPPEDDDPPPLPPKLPRSSIASPSPTRSSLVSKRLHGPRDANHGLLGSRRQRRKTVTFDERCDVVEFDVDDEMEENPFDSEDDYGNDDDPIPSGDSSVELLDGAEESFESAQAGDDSVTGLVDALLEDTAARTPSHAPHLLPPELDAQDDEPSSHAHQSDSQPSTGAQDPEDSLDSIGRLHSPNASSTPPRDRAGSPVGPLSPGSHIPLGRSTHSERAKAHKFSHGAETLDSDVRMLPPSPSPARAVTTLPSLQSNRESLIPKFDIDFASASTHRAVDENPGDDPFAPPQPKHDHRAHDSSDDSLDPGNLSIGHSEVSLSGLDLNVDVDGDGDGDGDDDRDEDDKKLGHFSPPALHGGSSSRSSLTDDRQRSSSVQTPPEAYESAGVVFPDSGFDSPSGSIPKTFTFPPRSKAGAHLPDAASRAGSPSNERVQLPVPEMPAQQLRMSSVSSLRVNDDPSTPVDTGAATSGRSTPMDVDVPSEQGAPPSGRPVSRHLNRWNNFTYDGVMSIDPEPQEADPPRPSILARAGTEDGAHQGVFEGLHLDFEQGFDVGSMGVGARRAFTSQANHSDVQLGDVSALDRLLENVASNVAHSPRDTGADAPAQRPSEILSSSRFEDPDRSGSTERSADGDQSMDIVRPTAVRPDPISRPATSLGFRSGAVVEQSGVHSHSPSPSPSPVQPPRMDAIRAREELIKAKKREARRRDMEQALGRAVPSRGLQAPRRTVRRRSMSTGDAEDLMASAPGVASRRGEAPRTAAEILELGQTAAEDEQLADSIAKELKKLEGPSRSNYHVRERVETIYAADADHISHVGNAGDIDGGKAWRTVRRPSDMNEYSKQIKELRAQDKSGKAHGKVFVKVLGIKNMTVPLPSHPTIMTCTLNNGIHFVTTPECRFGKDCRIDQEFELIEHSKLEFTLTIKIRRDPHIIQQFKANTPPPAPRPVVQQAPPPASKGGMRSFFLGSSPKKPLKPVVQPAPPAPTFRLHENLARYLKPDGVLARAFISFKDIAPRCDTRLFETTYPLIGQKTQLEGPGQSLQVGNLVLQIFRLPPLPGIPPAQLPQSLEECHRGLRHVNWHKLTYFEGTLTQNGGDCTSWRRRHLRIIGSSLVAYNDVTKRAITTIDLKKAVAVEDDQQPAGMKSPASNVSERYVDECSGPFGVERSFRLVFPRKQEITFFADTDEDKGRWLDVLRALVGHIPPNPLWAEMVWQRQDELAKQASGTASRPAVPPPQHPAGYLR